MWLTNGTACTEVGDLMSIARTMRVHVIETREYDSSQ